MYFHFQMDLVSGMKNLKNYSEHMWPIYILKFISFTLEFVLYHLISMKVKIYKQYNLNKPKYLRTCLKLFLLIGSIYTSMYISFHRFWNISFLSIMNHRSTVWGCESSRVMNMPVFPNFFSEHLSPTINKSINLIRFISKWNILNTVHDAGTRYKGIHSNNVEKIRARRSKT